LAVVLFADLAAVLPGDADGVFAFLRETGVVDDPGGKAERGWRPVISGRTY
jgi:predicted deacylase